MGTARIAVETPHAGGVVVGLDRTGSHAAHVGHHQNATCGTRVAVCGGSSSAGSARGIAGVASVRREVDTLAYNTGGRFAVSCGRSD